MMAKKLTIGNSKGGAGKTTTSLLVAYELAKRGQRVLFMDFDPQSNSTRTLFKTFYEDGFSESATTVFDGLKSKDLLPSILRPTVNFHFIPSSQDTANFGLLLNEKNEFTYFRNMVKKIEDDYDYIFFDTPPTTFSVFLNSSLAASDYFIVVSEVSAYSFEGIGDFYDVAERINQHVNKDLQFLGVLVNKREDNKDTMVEIAREYDLSDYDTFFRAFIPYRTRISKYAKHGLYAYHRNVLVPKMIETRMRKAAEKGKSFNPDTTNFGEYDNWDKEVMTHFETVVDEVLLRIKEMSESNEEVKQ
ncbi:ParA family protein [Exiguobacterium sp. SH5S4]|nr:ParA family protein [Exiguobacterium sp. SH5S4]